MVLERLLALRMYPESVVTYFVYGVADLSHLNRLKPGVFDAHLYGRAPKSGCTLPATDHLVVRRHEQRVLCVEIADGIRISSSDAFAETPVGPLDGFACILCHFLTSLNIGTCL